MNPGDLVDNLTLPEQRRKLLAQRLREKARQSYTVSPVSPAQRGVWFMQQVDPTTYAYNLSFCASVLSEISRPSVKASLQQLIDRHSMLRTTFRSNGDQVEMLVHGAGDAPFVEIDASAWTDAELQQQVEQSFRQPFNLATGPLIR